MNRDPLLEDPVVDLMFRHASGVLSSQMTLMYLLKMRWSVARIEALLGRTELALGAAPRTRWAARELRAVLDANRAGCERIAQMIQADVDHDASAPDVATGLAFCRRLFDWSVGQSKESSVALYSLGSALLLEKATSEVVEWLDSHGLLGARSDVLDIGCGIGRFEVAMAHRVRHMTGVDLSASMVAEARRRCVGLRNVNLLETEGRDLSVFAGSSFDLVLAVDSFPYLFQSGGKLLSSHFAEAARVLRPGGALAVFELSYGRSPQQDREDFIKLAASASLRTEHCGLQPFKHWDGFAFLARK